MNVTDSSELNSNVMCYYGYSNVVNWIFHEINGIKKLPFVCCAGHVCSVYEKLRLFEMVWYIFTEVSQALNPHPNTTKLTAMVAISNNTPTLAALIIVAWNTINTENLSFNTKLARYWWCWVHLKFFHIVGYFGFISLHVVILYLCVRKGLFPV